MNPITPQLLTRQRNFFLSAIALTMLPNLLIPIWKYSCIGFHVNPQSTWVEITSVILGIIGMLSTLAICAYGFYMGNKGYLKKYVAYTFVIYTIFFIIVQICRYVPAVKQMQDGLSTFGKQLYGSMPTFIAFIVMIISVKGSSMSRWMKWLIGLGWFGGCMLIVSVPDLLFTDEEISADPVMKLALPTDILYLLEYLLAALVIQCYYNKRIRKAEEEPAE